MSKIFLTTSITNKEGTHIFKGKGIKNKNVIIYKEGKKKTKLTLGKTIKLERIDDEIIELKFKKGIKLKGKYITKYGTLKLETYTKKIEEGKVVYDLYVNEQFVDTFEYNFEYSIDR